MASVYLAHDLKHDRQVALKVLHPELAATVGPERFQREIRTTARLQHPHILPVLDSGEADGQLWYAMPYVRGESLRARLHREAQLPVDVAIDLIRQIALALDYAHREGVVHRDLKPENILLSDGQALVADFGVAKALMGSGERQLTESGITVGTPHYMAPEQATGGIIDPRTDVYALGCILYEVLAGEPPYTGPTPQAILGKRLSEPVPHVRSVRDSVPEELEHTIITALAKVPADRFASAGELASVLTNRERPTPVTTKARSHGGGSYWPHPLTGGVLSVLFVVLVVGAVALTTRAAHRKVSGENPGTAGPTLLAVLPFENIGDSSNAYLAEGIASELRGKLASFPALLVIASASSNQYRRTALTPREIAAELGVQFLLVGHVQWEKGTDNGGRVRVSPELVDAATGTTKWQQPFETSFSDVFQVQADIAAQVAQALSVPLGTGERQVLAQPPTTNLAAYDAFLKGEAIFVGDVWDPASLRRAIGFYEQAVSSDSMFAPAWSQLARARGRLHFVRTPGSAASAEAVRVAAEHARTLAPDRPEGRMAWGGYLALVRQDFKGALQEYEAGLQVDPTNADLLILAATAEYYLGLWEASIQHGLRAQALDPRAVGPPARLAGAYLSFRRWLDARHEAERGLLLAPANVEMHRIRILSYVGQGDLLGAQGALRVASQAQPNAIVPWLASSNLCWLLDSAQRELLLGLTPAAFDQDRGAWALALAETYALQGDQRRMRLYADSSRLGAEDELLRAPENASAHTTLGVAMAYLGRREEAIREGDRGVTLNEKDRLNQPYNRHQLARIYLLLGDTDKALHEIEAHLKVPYQLSPGWLRIDPTFAPLRGSSRFQRLIADVR
jgi:serine/threonine-protein kinase